MKAKQTRKKPSYGDLAFGDPFEAMKRESDRKETDREYQQKYRVKGTGRINRSNHSRPEDL